MKATYTYLADGTKIKAVNAYNGGSDYVGSFKYNRNGSNISLESVATAGGRTYKTSGGYEARYFVTDHLGSTRLIAYPNGNVIEQNDYMPYGEKHANSSLATSGNPFLYNGKESQKSFGVNYIDSFARIQRTDGQFNSIDPLCELDRHISPYAYCSGNPINRTDPLGLWTKTNFGYTTTDKFEMRDFISAYKNNFNGKSAYGYVDNYYEWDEYIKKNNNVYTSHDNSDIAYSTAIPSAMVMTHNFTGRWAPTNYREIRNWQADFARNIDFHETMSNPIVQAVHRSQQQFFWGSMAVAGKGMEYLGYGIKYAGIGLTASGFGAGVGLAGIKTGSLISNIGTGMQIAYDLKKGNNKNWGYNAILIASNFGYGQLGKISSLTSLEQLIAQSIYGLPFDGLSILNNFANQ